MGKYIKNYLNYSLNEADVVSGEDIDDKIKFKFNKIVSEPISARLLGIIKAELDKVNEFFLNDKSELIVSEKINYLYYYWFLDSENNRGLGINIKYEDYYFYIFIKTRYNSVLFKFDKSEIDTIGETVLNTIKEDKDILQQCFNKITPDVIQNCLSPSYFERANILLLPKRQILREIIKNFNVQGVGNLLYDNIYITRLSLVLKFLKKNGINIFKIKIIKEFNKVVLKSFFIYSNMVIKIKDISTINSYLNMISHTNEIIEHTQEFTDVSEQLRNKLVSLCESTKNNKSKNNITHTIYLLDKIIKNP